MQSFQFGLRDSTAESMDDSRSRYVPSSVYSGPGPVDDSSVVGNTNSYMSGALRGPYDEPTPRFAPVYSGQFSSRNGSNSLKPNYPPSKMPRNSTMLNINDPVAMHLLTETAISDSRDFEILSFDEVEQLKKEKVYLRGKIESTRRKLALETKLRDAAQSLNRLYSTREKKDSEPSSPEKKRRSFLGVKPSGSDAMSRADDEYAASNRKVSEFAIELKKLEGQLEDNERRILMHTAGILQMTHKGLKKNIRKSELPRSPESMSSQPNGRFPDGDQLDDFDERSLYQVPDYVNEFGNVPQALNKVRNGNRETSAIDSVADRLQELNGRVHAMVTQTGSREHFEPPPQPTDDGISGRVGAQIQAYLGYLSQGLDAMERAQAYAGMDSGEQLEDVNLRLQGMLERTNSVSHSPLLPQDEPRGKDLQSQLAYSSVVLERLNQRVETLVEQKDILTRQIQQQRDLNNKSDAQRDAQIRELTQHLDQTKRLHQVGEEEAQHSRDQLNLLMEQLDVAKHENVLLEQQRGTSDNMALEAERAARKEMENKFLADMQNKQDEHSNLQAELNNARNETESRSQQLLQELNEAKRAQEQTALELEQSRTETANTLNTLQQQMESLQNSKSAAESELAKVREEMKELETEVVRAQTELTMVRAELDGAYGTRAQRAADVSMNPAVQKELDELNSRNKDLQGQLVFLTNQHETKGVGSAELQNKVNALQKELKDTIEEYEVMTKQSIEDEKERDRLEEIVDTLQQRCETVEMQLNEERLKWLGVKASSPSETTSTMVLKNEFKKMMRETRAENLKTIRAEQEERRRLETIIKSLKKDLQPTATGIRSNIPTTPNGAIDAR